MIAALLTLAAAAAIAVAAWFLLRRPAADRPEPAPKPEAAPDPDPEPEPEPEPEPVPEEMLHKLAERFRSGGPAPDRWERGWDSNRPEVVTAFPRSLKLSHTLISETAGGCVTIAVDGSVRDKTGMVSFAAVASNGRAIAGFLDVPVRNAHSTYAEMQGVRIGLRLVPPGAAARIAIDNIGAADRVRKILRTDRDRPDPMMGGRLKDASLAGDLKSMAAERDVRVKLFHNGSGQTHTNPLMALAHNLSFAIGHFANAGLDPIGDKECREFLADLLSPDTTRNRVQLLRRCNTFVHRKATDAGVGDVDPVR